jgi:hypothetical protein
MRHLSIRADAETGYELNPARSYFAIVSPEASVNLCMNPECVDLDGYVAQDGTTLLLSTAYQRRGVRSIGCISTAGSGMYYALREPLPIGKHFTFSVDIRGAGRFAIYFAGVDGPTGVGRKTVVDVPRFWNRYSVSLLVPNIDVSRLVVQSLDGGTFYVDGFQCENRPCATTFISGNLIAPFDTLGEGQVGYAWMGPAHTARPM